MPTTFQHEYYTTTISKRSKAYIKYSVRDFTFCCGAMEIGSITYVPPKTASPDALIKAFIKYITMTDDVMSVSMVLVDSSSFGRDFKDAFDRGELPEVMLVAHGRNPNSGNILSHYNIRVQPQEE